MSTGMIMSIIFLVTCYPIFIMIYFVYKKADENGGYCFGATLPGGYRQQPEVQAIIEEYRKRLKLGMIVLGIIPLPFMLVDSFSINMTLWMIWMLGMTFVPGVLVSIANRKIQLLKLEKGWIQEQQIRYTDIRIASIPRKVTIITFLPMLILSTVPMILAFVLLQDQGQEIFAWLVTVFGLCTYLFYLLAIWTDKQKVEVISEDSNINMNFVRTKKSAWKKFWVWSAWLNTVFTWVMLLVIWQRFVLMSWVLWGSIIYSVILLILAWRLVKTLFSINRTYESKKTIHNQTDDDSHWPYGLIYYNPRDKHHLVECRVGMGTQVNVGTKLGMGLTVFAGAMILLIPIMCVWMILMEFTPMQLSMEENTIVCTQLTEEYRISVEDIVNFETVEKLPEDMIKVNGSGMDNFLCGSFEVYRQGEFELFVNPNNHLFIKIYTEDATYYFSGTDDAETEEVLRILSQAGIK